ncbi:hypothetical protein BpHYR1_037043 [Brachionus plicatilis]|uniref:Uncharacterized protein n=1 Tax=Brachionus plicatilis TaxID=10195 RepID=A0A3M7SMI9_BRAPC|nr:hypothetical protein BpHYR1_037043 [Brachionus plicatilis]
MLTRNSSSWTEKMVGRPVLVDAYLPFRWLTIVCLGTLTILKTPLFIKSNSTLSGGTKETKKFTWKNKIISVLMNGYKNINHFDLNLIMSHYYT